MPHEKLSSRSPAGQDLPPVKDFLDQAPKAQTQRAQLLNLLREAKGGWVPLPRILELGIAQYNARIFDLRRAHFNIENKTEIINSERHSWFRLAPFPSIAAESGQPQAPADRFERRHRGDIERETPLFAQVQVDRA